MEGRIIKAHKTDRSQAGRILAYKKCDGKHVWKPDPVLAILPVTASVRAIASVRLQWPLCATRHTTITRQSFNMTHRSTSCATVILHGTLMICFMSAYEVSELRASMHGIMR